jgi:hypothetical protein
LSVAVIVNGIFFNHIVFTIYDRRKKRMSGGGGKEEEQKRHYMMFSVCVCVCFKKKGPVNGLKIKKCG